MSPATCSMLCSKDSAQAGVSVRNCKVISLVWIYHSFCEVSSVSWLFLEWNHFLLLDLLMSEVRSGGRVQINIMLTYPLAWFKEVCVSIRWAIIVFLLFENITIALTGTFKTPYACSICSIFLLYMESNMLEKSTNCCVVSKFLYILLRLSDRWSESVSLRIYFLESRSGLDLIENQGIISLGSYVSKSYASAVLCERRVWPFVHFSIMFYLQIALINWQCHHHHHHHHVAPSARISLTLSRHPSLLSIASGRSSRLHPVLAQSSCM